MAIDTSMLKFKKGKTRKQVKAKRDRLESERIRLVRLACVGRDGFCRVQTERLKDYDVYRLLTDCMGVSEWAHFGAFKRSKTRGLPADVRHTTQGSLMLCTKHHQDYDANRLKIRAGVRGCDGHLEFK